MSARHAFLPAILAAVLSVSGGVQAGGAGTTGASVLRIPAGARPQGMGGAYSAVADDLNSLFWNPAGLASIESPEVGALYTSYIVQTTYQVLDYAQPMGPLGTFAVAAGMLDYGSITRTVSLSDGLYGGTNGSVSAADWLLAGGWGRRVLSWSDGSSLDAGAVLKAVSQQPGSANVLALGGDGGVLWRTPVAGLCFSFVGDNLGALARGTGGMPMLWRLGSAWETPISGRLRAIWAADAGFTADAGTQIGLGMELTSWELIAVRAGWSGGASAGGVTFGLGFLVPERWTGMPVSLRMDYAAATMDVFGFTHRVQLVARLGGPSDNGKPHGFKVVKEADGRFLTWVGGRGPFEAEARKVDGTAVVPLTAHPVEDRRIPLGELPPGHYKLVVRGMAHESTGWRRDNENEVKFDVGARKPVAPAPAPATPLAAPTKPGVIKDAGRSLLAWTGTGPAYEVILTPDGGTPVQLTASPIMDSRVAMPRLGPGRYSIYVRAVDPADPSRVPVDSPPIRITVRPKAVK